MKRILFLLAFLAIGLCGLSQSRYYIRADSVYIEKGGGNGELIIRNGTRDSTNGVMVNLGGGRTAFLKSKQLTDSSFVIGKDTIVIRGIGGGGGSSLTNASGTGDTLLTGSSTIKRLDHDATLTFSTNGSKVLMGVDTFTNVSSKYYARSQITGIPARSSSYNTDKPYQGQVYMYNYPDSAFYLQFPTLNKIELWRGSGLKIFGHSLASPSTTPPTRTMHSTLLAATIGGPDSNLAVGGTNVQDQLKRINQENHLRKGETQSMLLCLGIDNRDDTSQYADRPAYHTAGIFAAVRCHRDTIVLLPDMSFTGTWTDFTQGLAAGGRTNGKITSTSGDFYQFQTLGGTTAFITFFSAHPNQDPTNYTDSVVISVDGSYHSSQSMANIGISGNSVPYMGIIFIHDLTDAPHTIRVTNRRNKPMAVDFAGALDYGKNCAPVMCEFISPVANIYIGGSGASKRLRINRLNRDYNAFISENFTRRGLPVICVNPLDGFDPNTHTIDGLHPDSAAQHDFYESIMRQVVIVRHADTLNQWNINGNANTTTNNFIGTTINTGVDIRTNGVVRARFGTNNNISFMQYQDVDAASSNSFLAGGGRLGPNALFAGSICRALANGQDAFAAGGPGCEANGILAFATGVSKVNGARGFGLINAVVDGDNGGALGYGAYCGSFFHIDIGYGSDTTGSYLWSKNSMISTDPLVTIGGARATDGSGGIVGRRTVLRINKNGAGYPDTAWFYNPGKVSIATTSADSNMLAAIKHVKSLIHDSLVAAGGADGNGIYGGSGSLPSDVTVTGGSNGLFFTSSRTTTNSTIVSTNSSSGRGLTGTSSTGIGVYGSSTDNVGVLGISTNGNGVWAQSTASHALYAESPNSTGVAQFTATPSSTNTVHTVLKATRISTSAGANGIGGAIDLENNNTTGAGSVTTSARLISKLTTATAGAEVSDFEIWGQNAGTLARKLLIAGNGQLTIDAIGTLTGGTPAYDLQTNSSGEVFPKVAPKVYTALLTQTSTNAPTAAVLGTNSIGSIAWSRTGTGTYVGTLSSAFTANKTWCDVNWTDESGGSTIIFRLKRTGSNTVELFTSSDGVTGTDVFTNLAIEIRVYP